MSKTIIANIPARKQKCDITGKIFSWPAKTRVFAVTEHDVINDCKGAKLKEESIMKIEITHDVADKIAKTDGSITADAVLKEFQEDVAASPTRIAWVLQSPRYMFLPAAKAARILRDGLGLPTNEIVKAIIRSSYLNLDSVANAIKHGLGLLPAEVARVLYSEDGLDLSAAHVARALYSMNGLKLSLVEIAKILYKEICQNPFEVAEAIKLIGASNSAGIALVLKDGIGLSPAEVARVLRSEDGFDMPIKEIAYALYEGLYLNARDVIRAIEEGIGFPDNKTEYVRNVLADIGAV